MPDKPKVTFRGIGRDVANIIANVRSRISKPVDTYFAPKAGKVRFRDIYRELPGAVPEVAKNFGQLAARGVATLGTAAGREAFNPANPIGGLVQHFTGNNPQQHIPERITTKGSKLGRAVFGDPNSHLFGPIFERDIKPLTGQDSYLKDTLTDYFVPEGAAERVATGPKAISLPLAVGGIALDIINPKGGGHAARQLKPLIELARQTDTLEQFLTLTKGFGEFAPSPKVATKIWETVRAGSKEAIEGLPNVVPRGVTTEGGYKIPKGTDVLPMVQATDLNPRDKVAIAKQILAKRIDPAAGLELRDVLEAMDTYNFPVLIQDPAAQGLSKYNIEDVLSNEGLLSDMFSPDELRPLSAAADIPDQAQLVFPQSIPPVLEKLAANARSAKSVEEFVSGAIFEQSLDGIEQAALKQFPGTTTSDQLFSFYRQAVGDTPPPQAARRGVAEEFKVGDILDPQGNTNMEGPITIREIQGNTLKFTDSKGTDFAGMQRSLVRDLIDGGSWKRVEPTTPLREDVLETRVPGGTPPPPVPPPGRAQDIPLGPDGNPLTPFGGPRSEIPLPPETATPDVVEFKQPEPFHAEAGRDITKVYEEQFGIPLEVRQKLPGALGRFYPTIDESGKLTEASITVRTLENLRTLAHETGHYLDFYLGQAFSGRKGATPARGILTYNNDLREELIKVSEQPDIRGPIQGSDKQVAYRRSSKELIADYISAYYKNPDTTKELSPEFTRIFEQAYATDPQVKYTVDKVRQWDEAFTPVKEFSDALESVPTLRAYIEGTDQGFTEPANILQRFWRNTIGDRVWAGVENVVDRIGQTRAGRFLVEDRGLPKEVDQILDARRKLIAGQQLRIDEELIRPLAELTPEEQKAVAKSLQVFEPTGEQLTEATRTELARWGKEARALGLLGDETFWNNVGQYFPYMYSSKEFGDNAKNYGYVNWKQLRSDMSGFKHRYTDAEFGTRVLTAKRLDALARAKAAGEVLENPPVDPATLTPAQLKQAGRDARDDMGLITTAAYPVKKRLDQMIQAVYSTRAWDMMADVPGLASPFAVDKTWVKIPEAPSYGKLGGMYVNQTVAQEVLAGPQFATTMQRISSIWKTLKVPYNPAALGRNLMTNTIVMWMGDTPIYNPAVVSRGLQSYASSDDTYKALRDAGLYNFTYSRVELQKLALVSDGGTWDEVLKNIVTAYEKPSQIYGAVEDLSKTVMARYAMDQGATPQEAVKYADKWLFDYAKASIAVETGRKGPFPFLTWSAKMFPRLIETTIRKPEKFIILTAAIAGANAVTRNELGITEDQAEAFKPAYLQERGTSTLLLPSLDPNGQYQYVDLSYILPWGSWLQSFGQGGLIPQALQPSNPLTILYNGYITNYDPFFREPIAPDYLPAGERLKLQTEYVARGFLPNLAPGGYGYQQIKAALEGTGDYYGRVRTPGQVITRNLTGINVIPGGIIEVRKKANAIQREIRDLKGDINLIYRNRGMDPAQKVKQIQALIAIIPTKYQELAELNAQLSSAGEELEDTPPDTVSAAGIAALRQGTAVPGQPTVPGMAGSVKVSKKKAKLGKTPQLTISQKYVKKYDQPKMARRGKIDVPSVQELLDRIRSETPDFGLGDSSQLSREVTRTRRV